MSETKRWVIIKPRGNGNCRLLLAKAASEEQISRIGNQTGGRVFLFLHTDDIQRDYQNLLDQQIPIVREPSKESFGKVAVFQDLYGNLWDLIEPTEFTNKLVPSSAIPQFAPTALEQVEKSYKTVLYISWSVFFLVLTAL